MGYRIFLDTNIFLDHLLARNAHSIDLIKGCEDGSMQPHASSATFFALAYFVGKYSEQDVKQVLAGYSDLVDLIPTLKENIYAAYQSDFSDLEDAFQYFTARNEPGMDFFVTSNVKDFKNSDKKLKVISPEGLLKLFKNEV